MLSCAGTVTSAAVASVPWLAAITSARKTAANLFLFFITIPSPLKTTCTVRLMPAEARLTAAYAILSPVLLRLLCLTVFNAHTAYHCRKADSRPVVCNLAPSFVQTG